MRAMGHGFDMQSYKGVVGGDGKPDVALHVANDGRGRWWRVVKLLVWLWVVRKEKGGL